MDYVDVLHVFLPIYSGSSGRITWISTCARWIKCIYYMSSYLCMVDQVDVLHWFLPVYDGLSERITCDPTCVR
jgi:hypothetical protein